VAIPLSGRVPGRASKPSRSWVDDGGGSQYVSGKVIGSLGFSRRGVFIGEEAASEVDQGDHHRAARPGPRPRSRVVRPPSGLVPSPLRFSGSLGKFLDVWLFFCLIPRIFPV
jgi:hypothetical protein